jgi:hypothetical protein
LHIKVEGIGAFGQPTLHSMISLKRDMGPFEGAFFSVDADIICRYKRIILLS